MIRGIDSIVLFSEKPRALAEFYRDIVGIDLIEEYAMGDADEEGFLFVLPDGIHLSIMHHSKVTGKNKEPERIMLNLSVDDIEELAEQLKEKEVVVIQDTYHIEDYGLIATFADIDGNYFQLVQTIPEEERDEKPLPN